MHDFLTDTVVNRTILQIIKWFWNIDIFPIGRKFSKFPPKKHLQNWNLDISLRFVETPFCHSATTGFVVLLPLSLRKAGFRKWQLLKKRFQIHSSQFGSLPISPRNRTDWLLFGIFPYTTENRVVQMSGNSFLTWPFEIEGCFTRSKSKLIEMGICTHNWHLIAFFLDE